MRPKLTFNDSIWNVYELKDIVSFSKGKNVSLDIVTETGFPAMMYGDIYIKYDTFFNKVDYCISIELSKDSTIIDKNTILMTCTGETAIDIGKSVCYLGETPICIGGDILALKCTDNTNAKFLCLQLNTYDKIKERARLSQGHSVVHLYQHHIEKSKIYKPDIATQTKIATFLNLYYKKIELQRKKVNLLKLQKNQIINTIFKFDDKVNYIKLNKLLNQISIKNKNNLDVPILSVSNKFGFIPQSEQFEEEVASDDKSNYKLVKLNQFAYNPARINVGSIAKLIDPYTCGQISPMYVCFECDSTLNSDYFGYYLQSSTFKKEMQKRLEGSVRMCLTFESLCNIKISLQELSKQLLVVDKLKKIDLKIKTEVTKLLLLEKYKQGLLQKMFI